MPNKPKLSIGIAAYGPQESLFWQPLGDMMGHLHEYVEYVDLLVMGVLLTHFSRAIANGSGGLMRIIRLQQTQSHDC
jgi:hypothetical protein